MITSIEIEVDISSGFFYEKTPLAGETSRNGDQLLKRHQRLNEAKNGFDLRTLMMLVPCAFSGENSFSGLLFSFVSVNHLSILISSSPRPNYTLSGHWDKRTKSEVKTTQGQENEESATGLAPQSFCLFRLFPFLLFFLSPQVSQCACRLVVSCVLDECSTRRSYGCIKSSISLFIRSLCFRWPAQQMHKDEHLARI